MTCIVFMKVVCNHETCPQYRSARCSLVSGPHPTSPQGVGAWFLDPHTLFSVCVEGLLMQKGPMANVTN